MSGEKIAKMEIIGMTTQGTQKKMKIREEIRIIISLLWIKMVAIYLKLALYGLGVVFLSCTRGICFERLIYHLGSITGIYLS